MTNHEALEVLEKNIRAMEKRLEERRRGGDIPDARTLAAAMMQMGMLVLHDLDLQTGRHAEAVKP